ncbi:DUF373 family protein [Candidatus Micrarchaeota archaeon]|nr:DUF373 family protein [Candidatus Micrarchaeota archaeon]
MEKEKIIIITIDRDNDMFEKTGITGPIIGRDKNLKCANALILADPEDVDANVIFQAIKTFDELSKKSIYDIEVCSLTGSVNLGFEADSNISQQLDSVLSQFPAQKAVIITDGGDDETVLPIISSRVKINSVKQVYMKQSKELEKTYFVILEKLKDPYYAKIIIGIPAVLSALLGITLYMNLGLEIFAILLSLFLFMRLFKIDERIYRFVKSFEFSAEKVSSLLYFIGIIILIFSFWIAQQKTFHSEYQYIEKNLANGFRSAINVGLFGFLIIFGGKMWDNWTEKHDMMVILHGVYSVYVVLLWMILLTLTDWILLDTNPAISFGDLFFVIFYSVFLGFMSLKVLNTVRINVLKKLRLEDKVVMSTEGMYMGRVKAVSKKDNKIIIETPFGKRFALPFSQVKNMVENRLFIKV